MLREHWKRRRKRRRKPYIHISLCLDYRTLGEITADKQGCSLSLSVFGPKFQRLVIVLLCSRVFPRFRAVTAFCPLSVRLLCWFTFPPHVPVDTVVCILSSLLSPTPASMLTRYCLSHFSPFFKKCDAEPPIDYLSFSCASIRVSGGRLTFFQRRLWCKSQNNKRANTFTFPFSH